MFTMKIIKPLCTKIKIALHTSRNVQKIMMALVYRQIWDVFTPQL